MSSVGLPTGALNFSSRAHRDDELSIAASEGGLLPSDADDSPGLPPSGVMVQAEFEVELAAVLA